MIQKKFNRYLLNNFKGNEKILLSISCGLDSTILYKLISNSNFFKKENIFFIIFDHKKRIESKYEISNFVQYYKIPKNKLFIKILNLKNIKNGFQEQSRLLRQKIIKLISSKNKITEIFLGHHLDDLNETFFIRRLQQSGIYGLSNIFSNKIGNLNYHRPLTYYTKKQLKNYAIKNKIIWYEDRSNFELDYTRNKIRNFLKNIKFSKQVTNERVLYDNINKIFYIHHNYFKRINKKKFEIFSNQFNCLNDTLKNLVVHSFYNDHFSRTKKNVRLKNILNFIAIIANFEPNFKKKSVFGGNITILNKKMFLNLN